MIFVFYVFYQIVTNCNREALIMIQSLVFK